MRRTHGFLPLLLLASVSLPVAQVASAAATTPSLVPASASLVKAMPTYSWGSVPVAGSTVGGVINLTARSSDGSSLRLDLLGPDGYDQLDEMIPSGGSYVLQTYRYTQGASALALSDGSGTYQAKVPITISNPPPSIASFSPGAGGVVATPGPVSVVPVEPAVTGLGIESVSYSIDGVTAGFVDQPPWQVTLPDLPPGPHLLSASVFDSGDRTFTASETITTVRASVLTRTDAPHTAHSGRAHAVTFTVAQAGDDPEPRPALGVTLSSRPMGTTGAYRIIGHASSDSQGHVSFPVTTTRSLELMATLDPVTGYAPATTASTLTVSTALTCAAHRLAGLAGETHFAGSCTVSPRVSGRPLVLHLGSKHGKILGRLVVRGSRFAFAGHASTKSATLVLVLADGSYTAGATSTLVIPGYATPPVAGTGPGASSGSGGVVVTSSCPPGYTSTKQCTIGVGF